jgi:hypothetical protein
MRNSCCLYTNTIVAGAMYREKASGIFSYLPAARHLGSMTCDVTLLAFQIAQATLARHMQ